MNAPNLPTNEPRSTAAVAMSALAWIVVLASFAAQVVLVYLLGAHREGPRGEARAFEAMGLLVMLWAAMWVVVPATVIATVRVALAARRQGRGAFRTLRVLFDLLVAFVMPALVIGAVVMSDRPRQAASVPDPGPAAQRTAGAAWALDNPIEREEDCKGSAHFVAGCTMAVRERRKR